MPMPSHLIIGTSLLFAIAGFVYGCDQNNKRKKEQKRARAKNTKLKKQISKLERKSDRLLPELGKQCHQIRVLTGEISRLQAEFAETCRRAG